jgi:hypothetical protein
MQYSCQLGLVKSAGVCVPVMLLDRLFFNFSQPLMLQFGGRTPPYILLNVLLGLDFRLFEKTRRFGTCMVAPPFRKWAAFRGANTETESFAPNLDYQKSDAGVSTWITGCWARSQTGSNVIVYIDDDRQLFR